MSSKILDGLKYTFEQNPFRPGPPEQASVGRPKITRPRPVLVPKNLRTTRPPPVLVPRNSRKARPRPVLVPKFEDHSSSSCPRPVLVLKFLRHF